MIFEKRARKLFPSLIIKVKSGTTTFIEDRAGMPAGGGMWRMTDHWPAQLLIANKFRIHEIKQEEVNLETAFMRLTKGIVQ